MLKAEKCDRELIVDILTKSFHDNKSVNYVVKQDRRRLERIKKLMEYSFDLCFLFGDVFLSDDKHGCALILYPEKKKTSLYTLFLDIKLLFCSLGIGNAKKVIRRERELKQRRPIDKTFCYGWYLAVDPEYRKGNIALKFIRELIAEGDLMKKDVYIETSMERNLPLYHYFGFEVIDTLVSGQVLYFLRRNPICK